MKISKLLQMLFGLAFMQLGVVPGEGGGGAGEGEGEGEGGAKPGEGEGEGEGAKSGEGEGEGAKSGRKFSDDEAAKLLRENMAKKEQLKKTTDELNALKKQFEGIDPEAVRKLLADQKTAEEKQLEARGDYDRLKQRMSEEHTKAIKGLQDQIAALQSELSSKTGMINDLTIGAQFGQSKFIAEELTLPASKARVLYGEYFDLEDGKVVAFDKPRGAAGRTAIVDQYGNAVGFDEAFRKIVEADPEKDHLLKSKIKPGAGSDSKRASGAPAKDATQPDAVSKIAAGLKGVKLA